MDCHLLSLYLLFTHRVVCNIFFLMTKRINLQLKHSRSSPQVDFLIKKQPLTHCGRSLINITTQLGGIFTLSKATFLCLPVIYTSTQYTKPLHSTYLNFTLLLLFTVCFYQYLHCCLLPRNNLLVLLPTRHQYNAQLV